MVTGNNEFIRNVSIYRIYRKNKLKKVTTFMFRVYIDAARYTTYGRYAVHYPAKYVVSCTLLVRVRLKNDSHVLLVYCRLRR